MENYKLIHAIIKTAVENGIRYIEDNPKRGLRNLLDLGEYFASGRFQKVFFDLAHEILNNEDSCYYDIIENLVKNTNHKILTTYGINMGYNSFTYGANIIREYEKNNAYNVPWTIVFNFEEESGENLTSQEISGIIKSGKNMGIYSYMILLDKNNILDMLYDIFDKNDDCAFTLFIAPDIISEETIAKIENASNICILVLIDNLDNSTEDMTERLNIMRRHKCLYGGYCYYDDSNAEGITSGAAESELLTLNLNFAVFIKKHGCSKQTAEDVFNYILKTRIKINSPVFMIDFYEDQEYIDRIISEEPCFLSINGAGRICVPNVENETEYNVRCASLKDVLKHTMPEVKRI